MNAATQPVAELMARVANQRDRRAFTELFHAYAPRLRGFYRHGGAADEAADELTQEVMLRIWRAAGTYAPERGSVDTWVFRIARNVRADRGVKQRHHEVELSDPALVASDPALVPGPETPAEITERARQAETLRAAVAALPAEQAEILDAVYFGAKTMQTVAAEHALPLGTVKSRIRLGFKRLRAVLATGGE